MASGSQPRQSTQRQNPGIVSAVLGRIAEVNQRPMGEKLVRFRLASELAGQISRRDTLHIGVNLPMNTKSGFRAWSREDIAGFIAALEQAGSDVARMTDSYEMQYYHHGYMAALHAFARMFGVSYTPELRKVTSPEIRVIEARAVGTP